MWWVGVTSEPWYPKENFALNMYLNNTKENFETCLNRKCVSDGTTHACKSIDKGDKCNKSCQANYCSDTGFRQCQKCTWRDAGLVGHYCDVDPANRTPCYYKNVPVPS